MKKFLLFSLLISLLALPAYSMKLEEGVHYVTLEWPEEKGKVVEAFSVFCSFCFKYELSVIPSLKASLPKGTVFEEIHLKEMGKYGVAANNVLAVALSQSYEQFYNAKMAYFNAVYIDRVNLTSDEQVRDIGLKAAQISASRYDELLKSPEVAAIQAGWDRAIDVAILQGTPSIIVNNKYMVLISSVKSQEEFNTIVNELLKK